MAKRKKKRKLKLIKTPPLKPKPKTLADIKLRNFWNTCPLQLEQFPESACNFGKQSAKARSDTKVPCEWAVNSKEHHYCFWKWLRENSNNDGTMRPMMQSEISELMDCSSTKIHFIIKDAIRKLKKGSYAHILAELAHTKNSSQHNTGLISSFIQTLEKNE